MQSISILLVLALFCEAVITAHAVGRRLNSPEDDVQGNRRLQTDIQIINSIGSTFVDINYSGFAVDGDPDTRWESERTDDQWVAVQFLSESTIQQVVLNWEEAYAKQYQIQVSIDGLSWTTVYEQTDGQGGDEVIDLSNVKGTYLAVRMIERATSFGYSLYEITVKGEGPAFDFPTMPLNIENAEATSEISPDVTARAVDSDLTTRWSSASNDGESITVQFQRYHRLHQVLLYWSDAFGESYDIMTSEDGKNWLTVFRREGGTGGNEQIDLPPGTHGRYVRMQGIKQGGSGYKLFEFIVLGSPLGLEPVPSFDIVNTVVSSVESGTDLVGANAADNDHATRWSSDRTDDEYIIVELEEEHFITELFIIWSSAYGKQFTIDTSTDGASFITKYTESNGYGGPQRVRLPSSTSAKFVRMQGVEAATQFGYSIIELIVKGPQWDPDDPPIVGRPPAENVVLLPRIGAVASSVETQDPTLVASLAIDGNRETRWASQRRDPQWIYVELAGIYTITKVVLHWEGTVAYASEYEIQVSLGGVNGGWVTVYSTSSGNGDTDEITFSNLVVGRYVRMSGSARGGLFGYSLFEFEVYGPTPPAPDLRPQLLNRVSAAASSVDSLDPTLVPQLAIDGDFSSRWASERKSDDEWLYVQLDGEYDIVAAVIYWEEAYATVYDIQVSTSAADGSWTTVYSKTDGVGGVDLIEITNPGRGRFVRMLGKERGSRFGYSLWEIGVWGLSP